MITLTIMSTYSGREMPSGRCCGARADAAKASVSPTVRCGKCWSISWLYVISPRYCVIMRLKSMPRNVMRLSGASVSPFRWPHSVLRNVVQPLPGRPSTSSSSPLCSTPSKLRRMRVRLLAWSRRRPGSASASMRAGASRVVTTVCWNCSDEPEPDTLRSANATPCSWNSMPARLTDCSTICAQR